MRKQGNRPSSRKGIKTSHVGKSNADRNYYTKAIKNLRSEPTLDESLNFIETDDADSDFSVPESTGRRKVPLNLKIKEHFEENWYIWVICFVVTVATPWAFKSISSNRERIIKIETKMDYTESSVREIKSELKEIRTGVDRNSTLIDAINTKPSSKK